MNSEQRITDLEIRFAHQDHYLQQLNEIVVNQQKTIERLEKEVLDIKNSIGGVGDVAVFETSRTKSPLTIKGAKHENSFYSRRYRQYSSY